MFWTMYFNFWRCNFLTMFQKIAKHRANDALHTIHRTPLIGKNWNQFLKGKGGLDCKAGLPSSRNTLWGCGNGRGWSAFHRAACQSNEGVAYCLVEHLFVLGGCRGGEESSGRSSGCCLVQGCTCDSWWIKGKATLHYSRLYCLHSSECRWWWRWTRQKRTVSSMIQYGTSHSSQSKRLIIKIGWRKWRGKILIHSTTMMVKNTQINWWYLNKKKRPLSSLLSPVAPQQQGESEWQPYQGEDQA